MAGMYARMTSATTQNQNIAQISALGAGLNGILQGNPGLVTATGFSAAITPSTVSSAPAALQAWLSAVFMQIPETQSVTFSTGTDPVSGAACAPLSGCQVTVVIAWNPTANNFASSRSQTFTYQVGLGS